MKNINIKVADIEVEAQLNDSKTAGLIWDKLSVESSVNTWGQEIYFDIPVRTGLEKAVDIVKTGEIRPASKVNLVGKVLGDVKVFKKIKPGEKIIVERVG